MANDYYDRLGVDRGASKDDIKKAFHRLAHKHHPDKEGGDEARFKEINEAYQILSDDKKRASYDQFDTAFDGAAGARGAGGFGGFGDFSSAGIDFDLGDIFGEFFGGSRGRGKGTRHGSDIHVDITVDLREAVFGATKRVSLNKTVLCVSCQGSGGEPGSGTKRCASCDGRGKVVKVQATILGQFQTTTICPTCWGEGNIPNKPCLKCHGEGIEKQIKELDITIPAGIDDGQMVRITGEGEAAGKGAKNGDLLVTVHVRPDPRFTREGPHLLTTVPISFSQSSLGDKIEVTLLDDKKIKLKIPAGTQSGKIFRVSGKGAGSVGSSRFGDLLITVQIKTPTHLSRKQKKLLEEMSEEGL